MIYAPILIPTLNRVRHLKRCIESLQNNKWAEFTDLIISVDYPPNEKYLEGYHEIKKYLRQSLNGFKKVTIIEQEYNLGAYGNYVFLIKYVSGIYDRFIFTEDDNEMSINFIEYMDKGLELFCEDCNIIAICSNCVSAECTEIQTVVKTQNFSAQGYGSWVETHNKMEKIITRKYLRMIAFDNNKLVKIIRADYALLFSFKQALFSETALYSLEGNRVPIIDMTIKIYAVLENKTVVCSRVPTSRNWGYDGTGVNCPDIGEKHVVVKLDSDEHFNYMYEEPMYTHRFQPSCKFMTLIRILVTILKISVWRFKIRIRKEKYK